jgi:transcriptional regulator with XRE-family HTH domain
MPPSIHDSRYRRLRQQLRALRMAAGLTQEELALRLGIDQSNLSKIERGERYVDVLFYLDWCRACGTDPGAAMSGLAALDV